jgi:hypothetical protein
VIPIQGQQIGNIKNVDQNDELVSAGTNMKIATYRHHHLLQPVLMKVMTMFLYPMRLHHRRRTTIAQEKTLMRPTANPQKKTIN